MATKEELTTQIESLGATIKEMKTSKAPQDDVMAKVDELKALKTKFKDVTGEDFGPPPLSKKEQKDLAKKKKAEAAAAAAVSAAGASAPAPAAAAVEAGPSKNEQKKAAKEAAKAAKRAEHKSSSGGIAGASEPAAPNAAAAAAKARTPTAASSTKSGGSSSVVDAASVDNAPKSKIHRSVTATSDLPADLAASSSNLVLAGATLHFHPTTAFATGFALANLATAGGGLQTSGLSLSSTRLLETELPRLVLAGNNGGQQIVGDHAIAKLVLKACGVGLGSSLLAEAATDQWMDLAAMFCGDEAPLLTLLDQALSAASSKTSPFSFLSGSATEPGMGDAALFACITSSGGSAKVLTTYPAVAKWFKAVSSSKATQAAKLLLAGKGTAAGKGAGKGAAGGGGGASAAAGSASSEVVEMSCPPLEGAIEGQVVTRFPPEPSGFLHIGHAKAVLLNEYYARHYKGKLLVRFDDTNPSKEKVEFEENIKKDLLSMGVVPDSFSHSSDHFEKCQELAKKMLTEGKAYMDDTDQETMKEERAERKESKHRNQDPKTALKLFEAMLKGQDKEAANWCMRAKLDMSSDNGCLRDPVCYRANDTPHHRTGTKFKAYPTYDFACPIVDAIEGVTHCLRSTEFNDRNPQYHALQEMLGVRHVRIWEYGKLQFVYTVLSKRKLQWFVDKGIVPDWNDPRFPTVQGCVRRGVTMSALRKFIYAQGASRNIVLQEWDKFWSVNKEEFEPSAPRYFGVAKKGAVTLTLSGGDADLFGADDCEVAAKTVACVPSNESLGTRPMRLGQSVVLEAEDAATCKVGDKIILLWWGVVEITAVVVDDDSSGGGLTKLEGVRLPEVKPSSKMKQKFNWVCSDEDVVEAQIVEFDHLITKPKIEEDDKIENIIRELTKGSMPVLVEPCLKLLKQGDIVQLVRRGFFRVDAPYDPANPVGSLELVLIPDGKKSAMSTLSTALPHH